jgi:hypothetical protein
MGKIEKSLQMFKKEGSSSKPANLIKEFLPHGSSAKALRDREKCPPLRTALEDIALQFFIQMLKN